MSDSRELACVLYAILGGANFREIMSIGDGITHSVPTSMDFKPNKIQRALKELEALGLAEKIGRRYKATPKGLEIYKAAASPLLRDTLKKVAAAIDRMS